ncbi:hypothetical protein ACO22_00510 [Paracoccidioides brasiliensis]|uniref:DNA endonuclease activator Ctp1 C-terminal domain-containing protein n=1 Tax=Paracoccidioides brasiliensis TaxID=121759 RepID=A0A1D2JP06_PARBR|nr:hypothetical protein ACO22_00510 [Paracoccidioides brasiliensis]
MESIPLKVQQSPGTPLRPVSPDRINQQKMNGAPLHALELSPLQQKHMRTNSDVQAKVAFLNHLSRASTPAHSHPSSTTSAALHRAILGREEAEASLQATMAELSEANLRERKVSERLESLMEELHSLKERQAHERVVFEKEVRRARKEAFRAGSALVKAQEELKSSRGEVKVLKEEVRCEREAKEKATQEAFERAYALAGLTEELEILKEKNRSFEPDNQSDILEARVEEIKEQPNPRTPLAERDMGICSPKSIRLKRDQMLESGHLSNRTSGINHQITSSRMGSPLKIKTSRRTSSKENEDPELSTENDYLLRELKEGIEWEKRLRLKAEDMVHFLKMECQFHRCSCRLAEMQGVKYIHDTEWENMNRITEESGAQLFPNDPGPSQEVETRNQIPSPIPQPPSTDSANDTIPTELQATEPEVAFCPHTGTFKAVSPSKAQNNPGAERSVHQQIISREHSPLPAVFQCYKTPEAEMKELRQLEQQMDPPRQAHYPPHSIAQQSPQPPATLEPASSSRSFLRNLHLETAQFPARAEHADARTPNMSESVTVSATKTVPIHPDDYISNANFPILGTPITREEALAQIRARRNRAQSLKRSASANDAPSRSFSRPQSRIANSSTTPMSGSRRTPGMETTTGSRPASRVVKRDFSAPIGSSLLMSCVQIPFVIV